jgi:hypothetical protein
MTLVRQEGSDRPVEGPPCPYWGAATNDRHLFFNRLKDRLYHHLKKDDNGDVIEEDEASKLYHKIDEMYPYHMYLYRADPQAINRFTAYVDTYYYLCSICYFVLPVTQITARPL